MRTVFRGFKTSFMKDTTEDTPELDWNKPYRPPIQGLMQVAWNEHGPPHRRHSREVLGLCPYMDTAGTKDTNNDIMRRLLASLTRGDITSVFGDGWRESEVQRTLVRDCIRRIFIQRLSVDVIKKQRCS